MDIKELLTAIQYVGTPLALLAFIAAGAAIAYLHKLRADQKKTDSLAKFNPAGLDAMLETYSLKDKEDNLLPEQKTALVSQVIQGKVTRLKYVLLTSMFFGLLFVGLAAYAFWIFSHQQPSPPLQPPQRTERDIERLLLLNIVKASKVASIDTIDFPKQMISQPIDASIAQRLVAQGLDLKLLLLLLFSQLQTPNGKIYLNNLSCNPDELGRRPQLGCYVRMYDYMDVLGLALSGHHAPRFALYHVSGVPSPKITLCFDGSRDNVCTTEEAVLDPSAAAKVAFSLTPRSGYDILIFVGQIPRFQAEVPVPNRCITLDPRNRTCDTGEVLFQVNAPVGRPVVATRYDDQNYTIYVRECNSMFGQPCDHSSDVLSILKLLLKMYSA